MVCPLAALRCVFGVLGHSVPVHRCARSVWRVACSGALASWLLFTGVRAWCVLCALCAVSWATWLLFTGVPARSVALLMPCPGPLGSCSPLCPLGVLCCVCGVLSHLAPVHRSARSVCCVACAVSWASSLPFTGVPPLCAVLCVRCPEPLGSCSPVCRLGAVCCVCDVLGHLAPVRRCARSVCCVACAVSWATWLLFTGVPARCVLLRVRCPEPLGSCSPVCLLGAVCYVFRALGPLPPFCRCGRSVRCVACAVPWATWLLLTGVHTRRVVFCVWCPWPLGSCSAVCTLAMLCCVFGVLGRPASVHPCARSVCGVACAVSGATWLLFTGVLARCVALRAWRPRPLGLQSGVCSLGVLRCVWRVRCPGPLGSCSPVRAVCALLRVRGVAAGCALVHPDGGLS